MSVIPNNLAIPVPYTLKMLGNGNFIAKWHPAVPTPGFPEIVTGESRTSGITALERLVEQLIEKGIIPPKPDNSSVEETE